MDYLRLTCTITTATMELAREILSQELADLGFESFEETSQGLLAYIPEKNYSDELAMSLPSDIMEVGKAEYSVSVIRDRNWNEEWEKNFQPVLIADKCYIRAPFHEKDKNAPYDIVIEPKMAFGTGHHETTSLMVEQMLSLDISGKQILDMGCGTGVLAIMASMLKAGHIWAIDIDEWAFQSTNENCKVNCIGNVSVYQGDIGLIEGKRFDIILANINRNILLNQIPYYSAALPPEGLLLMSGIYRTDFDTICQAALANGFTHIRLAEKNNWIAVLFAKS